MVIYLIAFLHLGSIVIEIFKGKDMAARINAIVV